jgi:hypothetical protein
MFGLALLIACGLYVWVALFVAKQVGKGMGSNLAKYLTLTVFVLLPTWDILPGQLYHQHLCKTEGGVKVFKTIEVDKAYFQPDGRSDEKKIEERVEWQMNFDRSYSTAFHIARSENILIDRKTGERLGTAIGFAHYGGWFEASFLRLGRYTLCPQYPHHSEGGTLLREVIHPISDLQGGGK